MEKRGNRGLRVLLVDDIEGNRALAHEFLENMGHSVVEAVDGLEAVEGFVTDTFDLILMDVQMPRMSGIEATEAIRKFESGTDNHIPIIGITAYAMTGDQEKCLKAGMDGYLTKPLDCDLLCESIDKLSSGAIHS